MAHGSHGGSLLCLATACGSCVDPSVHPCVCTTRHIRLCSLHIWASMAHACMQRNAAQCQTLSDRAPDNSRAYWCSCHVVLPIDTQTLRNGLPSRDGRSGYSHMCGAQSGSPAHPFHAHACLREARRGALLPRLACPLLMLMGPMSSSSSSACMREARRRDV